MVSSPRAQPGFHLCCGCKMAHAALKYVVYKRPMSIFFSLEYILEAILAIFHHKQKQKKPVFFLFVAP